MNYSDAHRLFLQILSRKRSLDELEATKLMKKCCTEAEVRVKNLEEFVLEINVELKHMQLVVRMALEERDSGDHMCLVLANLMSGEATRELGSFSKQELSFMQALVIDLVGSGKGEVDVNVALNIGARLNPKLKPSACEDLLQRLLDDKWLIQTQDEEGGECMSLSALSMTELTTYLEESFPEDIHKCFFCTKLTLRGYKCDRCNISVHRDCAKKYWANREGYECPGNGCKASLLLNPPPSHNKRRRTGGTEQEEESMDEDETEVVEGETEGEEEEEEEIREVVPSGSGRRRRLLGRE